MTRTVLCSAVAAVCFVCPCGCKSKSQKKQKPPPRFPVKPDALPVCNKKARDEPLAAVCALGKPATTFPAQCAKPEPFMFCNGSNPPYARWGCRDFRDHGGLSLQFETRWNKPLPPLGTKFTPPPVHGTVAGVAVLKRVPTPEKGDALVRTWTRRFEQWGCRAIESGLLKCGGFTVDIRYAETTKMVHLEARNPGAAECDRLMLKKQNR